MAGASRDERGSALAEAAIVFPCLVLVVFWSAALTDVLLLKLKAAEAARYALWESTVLKPPARIALEVEKRFSDLASPRGVDRPHTGLLLYPRARDLRWRAEVDMTSSEAGLAGSAQIPAGGPGVFARGIEEAFRAMRLNTRGVALVRVGLRARRGGSSPIFGGGDLPGLAGGGDLGAPRSLLELALQAPLPSRRPLRLVFDTWKAWPRPAAYSPAGGGTDVTISPSRTYPEVERQVSAQVGRIAFAGAGAVPGLRDLQGFAARLLRSGVGRTVAGGTLPDIFSAGRMDDRAGNRGPITILPPERATESWVPHRCEIAGADVPCPTQRLGDVTSAGQGGQGSLGEEMLGDGVDRPRYTVPYRIRSVYWSQYGGMDRELRSERLEPPQVRLSADNEYVRSYDCRGHFFAGSRAAQQAGRFGSCR